MDYEKKMNKNVKRNEKYLLEFEKWLNKKGLVDKTIRKHLNNVSLFVNDYLNYYDITKAEDGLDEVFPFLNDWFIRKCLWSSRNSLKETAASLKKFYQYMSENNYVDANDYKETFNFIKDNMNELLESVDEFNNFDDDYYYDLF